MRTLYAATVALIEAGPMPAPLATAVGDAWHATMKDMARAWHAATCSATATRRRTSFAPHEFLTASSFTLAAR